MQVLRQITKGIAGIGLAASLFLGCQDFLGRGDQSAKDNQPPEEMALNIAVKDDDSCRALLEQVKAARAAGTRDTALENRLVKTCIEELGGKLRHIIGRRVPDSLTRCHWMIFRIDGGRHDLILKLRYWCPDSCRDTTRRICIDPRPDCDALKKKLAGMDPASPEYARLSQFIQAVCVDRIAATCDEVRKKLAALDPNSPEYARVKAILDQLCP